MFSIDLKIDGVLAATFDGACLPIIINELDYYIAQFVPPESEPPNLIQIYIRNKNKRRNNARHRNVREHIFPPEVVVSRPYDLTGQENDFITL